MTKLEFEKILIPLIEYIDDIEMDLIVNILDRIDNYDGVKGSLKWYTDKLLELKLLDKDNSKVFEKDKNKLKRIISQLAEDCGYRIDNLDKLNEYYDKGLLNKNPINLYDNIAINSLINETIKDTIDIMNLIQTKAIEGANKAYKDILNKAYIETASGTYTYTESIRRALDEFAKHGIKAAHYKNGTSLSIEAVVRRDVITRMNKLNGDVELEQARALDTNLVYVDQHLGARVRTEYTKHDYEAHAEWQGKKYMIEGSSEKYENIYEATGYGEMLGLKGINCYHNIRPTWEWEEIDEQIDLEENAKVRAILDKRNYYARKIRYLKHKRINAKTLDDKDEYKKINQQFKTVISEYDKWLKDNNLARDYNREYVSQKIGKKKVNYSDVTSEWKDIKNSDGIVKNAKSVTIGKKKYSVNHQNKIIHKNNEEHIAKIMADTFGGTVKYLPDIGEDTNVRCGDLLYRNEIWDIKELGSRATSEKRAIDNLLKESKGQSNNFILDITHSALDRENIIKQIEKIYSTKNRDWIDKIIIFDHDKLVRVYKKSK